MPGNKYQRLIKVCMTVKSNSFDMHFLFENDLQLVLSNILQMYCTTTYARNGVNQM